MVEPKKDPKQLETLMGTFGDDFLDQIADVTGRITDNGLLLFGDVKDYTGARRLTEMVAQAVVLDLVDDGYLALTEISTATQEERAKRSADKANRKNGLEKSAEPYPNERLSSYL